MIAASIAFLTRGANRARVKHDGCTAIIGALICAMNAIPAQSQMLGLRAAADAQSPETIVANAVEEASRRFNIPAAWVRAVMRAESHGGARSVSKKGAIGLMQLMPKTYAELRIKLGLGPNPFDPYDNIVAGAAYLADLFERYGEMGFLAAYNAGPQRFEDYLRGRPLPNETTDYVARLALTLGLASIPTTQDLTATDILRAPLFVTLPAPNFARERSTDGEFNGASRSENAAPHLLFAAQRDREVFVRDPHSDRAWHASVSAVDPHTADIFVAHQVSESIR
jgi:hypothetical protein